jgi:hypothetical protein
LIHLPQYQTPEGYSTTATASPEARETVRYEALVLQVELLRGGELTYGSARTLSNRGWGLQMSLEDRLAGLREAARLYRDWPPEGQVVSRCGVYPNPSDGGDPAELIADYSERNVLAVKVLDQRVDRPGSVCRTDDYGFQMSLSPLESGNIPPGGA